MRMLAVVVVLGSVVVLAWSALRLNAARAEAESAASRLAATRDVAQQVVDLRARSERISIGARPEQDTTARVLEALTAAGVPRTAFRSLSPEADTPLTRGRGVRGNAAGDGATYHRQSFRLTLEPVDARQLGAFLEAWRGEQAAWTVERVELTHAAAAARGTHRRATDEDRYSARLTIAAMYIAENARKESKP